MNDKEIIQADEASLLDLLEKLQEKWKFLLGGIALGAGCAVLALVLSPAKFEASAVIQVGQIGQVGPIGQSGQLGLLTPIPVEPPAQTVERMKSPSFQQAVARALGDDALIQKLSESSSVTTKFISIQLTKTAPVIELKTFAESPEKAKVAAEAVIVELEKKQNEIAKPMLDKMRFDLAIARERLASAEREQDGLNRMMSSAAIKDERFTQLSLISTMRAAKETEIFAQRQLIAAYETALMPPATQPARALEPVYSGNLQVSPKKGLFLALGLVFGLFGGGMVAFGMDAWKRRHADDVSVALSA